MEWSDFRSNLVLGVDQNEYLNRDLGSQGQRLYELFIKSLLTNSLDFLSWISSVSGLSSNSIFILPLIHSTFFGYLTYWTKVVVTIDGVNLLSIFNTDITRKW